jgi:dTDP-4-amino-4,6-dideoxygalactose transaminase
MTSTLPRVPLFNLRAQNAQVAEEVLEAISALVRDSAFVGGPTVEQFEEEFAVFCGAPYGVAVSTGTEAIRLALQAAGVRPGDEVITTPFTFIGTSEGISMAGGRIVFADVDPRTANLDPASVESKITERTRAILPVHLYGRVANMEALRALAERRKLLVVEDACQAHGARREDAIAGSIGDAAAFSFYPSKNLGAFGEGGFVTTRSKEIARKVRLLRTHGQVETYKHAFEGTNARLAAIQCAALRVKLTRLGEWTAARRRLAARYVEALSGLPGIEPPREDPDEEPVYHLFVIQADRRDELKKHLGDAGIDSGVYYPIPLHLQECYRSLGPGPSSHPVAERLASRVLALPMFPEMSTAEQDRVIAAVRGFGRN